MSTELSNLVRVRKPEAEKAIEAIARAFQDYTMFRYFYPDEEKRRTMLRYLMAAAVYFGLKYGEVYASAGFEGTAVWVPSENCPLTFGRILRSVPLPKLWGLMKNMTAQMKEPNDFIDAAHLRLAPFRHLYLQSIGVNPLYQGQGFSGKLIKPMLARLDETGLPCYLETLEAKNVALYEHLGFRLIEEAPIPGTPLVNRAMLRDAGK